MNGVRTMKRTIGTAFLAATALAIATGGAMAQAVPSRLGETVSFDLGGTYLNGEAREYVYDPDTRKRLSYLNWRFDQVYAVTAGMTYHILPTVALRANGWFPIEKEKGTLKDFDYILNNGLWSDFSKHPTTLREAYRADASLAVSFYTTDFGSIYAIGGYRQQMLHFAATGGSYVYSLNGFRDLTGNFPPGEPAISYMQTSKTPYLGIGATAEFGVARVTGEVVGSLFTKTDGKDTHYQRDLVFYDRTYNGKFVGATIKGEYDVVPNVSVTGAVTYDQYFDSKGKTKILDQDTGDTFVSPKGSSGAGSSVLGVTVGVKARM